MLTVEKVRCISRITDPKNKATLEKLDRPFEVESQIFIYKSTNEIYIVEFLFSR